MVNLKPRQKGGSVPIMCEIAPAVAGKFGIALHKGTRAFGTVLVNKNTPGSPGPDTVQAQGVRVRSRYLSLPENAGDEL